MKISKINVFFSSTEIKVGNKIIFFINCDMQLTLRRGKFNLLLRGKAHLFLCPLTRLKMQITSIKFAVNLYSSDTGVSQAGGGGLRSDILFMRLLLD